MKKIYLTGIAVFTVFCILMFAFKWNQTSTPSASSSPVASASETVAPEPAEAPVPASATYVIQDYVTDDGSYEREYFGSGWVLSLIHI